MQPLGWYSGQESWPGKGWPQQGVPTPTSKRTLGAHHGAGEGQLFVLLFALSSPSHRCPSALGELGTWGHPTLWELTGW